MRIMLVQSVAEIIFIRIFANIYKPKQIMKRHFILLSVIALAAFCLTSCVVYHPHTTDIPLLNEKGDLSVDANVSMSAPLLVSPAINATVAYAPFNMIGMQAAASITDFKNYHTQMAVGTWQAYGLSVLECYIGYAYGHSYNDTVRNVTHNIYYVDGNYNMVFSQINFGWRGLADNSIDVGFGFKGGLLFPKWDKIELLDDGTETLAERHDDAHFLIEPQLMFRFGWDKVKISLNLTYAFLTAWPTDNNYFNYERFGAGLGLHFNF